MDEGGQIWRSLAHDDSTSQPTRQIQAASSASIAAKNRCYESAASINASGALVGILENNTSGSDDQFNDRVELGEQSKQINVATSN